MLATLHAKDVGNGSATEFFVVSDFTRFSLTYSELKSFAERAQHSFFVEHLQNWFAFLDETPEAKKAIQELEQGLDVKEFLSDLGTKHGMLPAPLNWPTNRRERLGMKLLVFREMSEGRLNPLTFAHTYVTTAANVNENIHALSDQIFYPMTNELLRYIEREFEGPKAIPSTIAPAADRVVRLDHNSSAYKEAIETIERLRDAIQHTNDFFEPEEKEQRIAEVSAARRLFDAVLVRVEPIIALLRPLVVQFGTKLKENLISLAVSAVTAALITLFGGIFHN
jgi:hypothetical protein